jgi:hypothetical protein
MISSLGVMQFWSQPDCWISRLIRFEQSENFKLLSVVQVQSQKTSNTKLVVNFLNFPVITHTLKYDKQRRSYDHWNTVYKWRNLGYRFWFGLTTISQNLADWIWGRIRRNEQYKSGRNFLYLSKKYRYTLIQSTVQELRSLQVRVLLEISCFLDRSRYLCKFEIWAHF